MVLCYCYCNCHLYDAGDTRLHVNELMMLYLTINITISQWINLLVYKRRVYTNKIRQLNTLDSMNALRKDRKIQPEILFVIEEERHPGILLATTKRLRVQFSFISGDPKTFIMILAPMFVRNDV